MLGTESAQLGCAPAHSFLVCLDPAGKDWSMDTDWEDAAVHVQRGYLAMLAIDSLLAFMGRRVHVARCLLASLGSQADSWFARALFTQLRRSGIAATVHG